MSGVLDIERVACSALVYQGTNRCGLTRGILQSSGLYMGDYTHDFVAGQLKHLGVRTFSDLRLDDELPRTPLPAGGHRR